MSVTDPGDSADARDLRAMALGDPAGFEALFDRHSKFLYNFAFRRTANWATAEDITEVVFLELWRQRHRLETKNGSLRPWLVSLASNHVKRGWRSAERQARAYAKIVRWIHEGEDVAEAVASRTDDERRMAELLETLRRLPRAQREVLQLWAWERLSYEEIAAALGIAVGTVRSRLNRARARLRDIEGTDASPWASRVEPLMSTAEPLPAVEDQGGLR